MLSVHSTVYKETVPFQDEPVHISLPWDSYIVHVGMQGVHGTETVVFWYERPIEPKGEPLERLFRIFGTGHPIPSRTSYIGTVQALNGLVWHLYEIMPEPTEEGRS